MRITLARIAVATAAMVATTLIAPAPIAQAAAVRSFDVATIAGASPHHGSARAWGSLSWHDKTKLVIDGRIDDRCPADGYGAYLDVAVHYMNGDLNKRLNVARDTSSCDDPGSDGVPFGSPVVFDSTRWIWAVHVCLWEIDADTSPDSLGDHACKTYYNPHI
jgi:hypothetical protein